MQTCPVLGTLVLHIRNDALGDSSAGTRNPPCSKTRGDPPLGPGSFPRKMGGSSAGARVLSVFFEFKLLGPGSSLYDGEGIPCWGQGPPRMMGRGSNAGARISALYDGDGIQCWGQDPPPPTEMGSSAGARVLPV